MQRTCRKNFEVQHRKTRGLWSDAFRRMVRNRLSMAGLFIFLLLFITAIFGPYLAPYPYMLQDLGSRR